MAAGSGGSRKRRSGTTRGAVFVVGPWRRSSTTSRSTWRSSWRTSGSSASSSATSSPAARPGSTRSCEWLPESAGVCRGWRGGVCREWRRGAGEPGRGGAGAWPGAAPLRRRLGLVSLQAVRPGRARRRLLPALLPPALLCCNLFLGAHLETSPWADCAVSGPDNQSLSSSACDSFLFSWALLGSSVPVPRGEADFTGECTGLSPGRRGV